MLKELKNIRSFNELTKALGKITASVKQNRDSLKQLTNVSQSSDLEDAIVIGNKPSTITTPPKASTKETISEKNPEGLKLGMGETAKANIPDDSTLKKLSRYATIINSMYNNIDNIKVAKHIGKTQFSSLDAIDDYLASCDKLIAEAQDVIANTFNSISGLAKKHAPKKLELLARAIQNFFLSKVTEDMYSSITKTIQVVPVKDSKVLEKNDKIETLLFAITIRIRDFKLSNDRSVGGKGFSFREFDLVTTAKIDVATGLISYYVTAKPEFSLPGTYDVGKEVNTEKSAIEAISKLISYYNFSMFIDRKPISVDDTGRSNIAKVPGVEKVKVVNDAITVLLRAGANDKVKQNAMLRVFELLRNAYGNEIEIACNDTRRLNLVNKKTKEKEQHVVLHFSFSSKAGKKSDKKIHKINAEKLEILREQLGLTPADMSEIKKLIWK